MKITYDEEADAMYIYLSEREVAKTVRPSSRVIVDLDGEENLRGIEILFVSEALADTDFSHLHLQLPKVGEIDLQLPVTA